MNYELHYWGHSGAVAIPGGTALSFAPNLARPKVFFDQGLKAPLRFREAISALHEVVVGDFKYRPRDRSAHTAWLKAQAEAEAQVRRAHTDRAYAQEFKALGSQAPRAGLDADFRAMHQVYWKARNQWAADLSRSDPALFRALVPCDPIVTVAPDVVFFEGFARDESSYGALFVDRGAFEGAVTAGLGTTNVDYSLGLYDAFQALRSYRATRLVVDPTGFEVQTSGQDAYREEKIDLPPAWLRGFGQLQGAMTLPARRVELSLDVVYSILAWLRRHREKEGPRALRFELVPGRAPQVVLEPWGTTLVSRGRAYDGPAPETIKVWGRRRLAALHRLLPLAERVEVQLLGSGLPSIWSVAMGELRFVLGLSGWSQNDWASGAALQLLSGDLAPQADVVSALEAHLAVERRATLEELKKVVVAPRAALLGSLHELCRLGQVMYDFSAGVYRARPVMPWALSEAVVGPEPEEVREGQRLRLELRRDEPLGNGRRLLVGAHGATVCEAVLDADGGFSKATCGCSHFHRFRLRAGPCRHLLALRLMGRSKLWGGLAGVVARTGFMN